MKIEAKDLRIGNLVFSKETQENQIINGIDTEYVYLDCITFDYQTLEDIEPIPLTEEWLLKFGFNKDNDFEIEFNNGLLTLIETSKKWYPNILENPEISNNDYQIVSLNCIKHVHQLQNIYHALTQKELKI